MKPYLIATANNKRLYHWNKQALHFSFNLGKRDTQITWITFRNSTLNAVLSHFVTCTELPITKAVTSVKETRDYLSISSHFPTHCFKVYSFLIIAVYQEKKVATSFPGYAAFVKKSNRGQIQYLEHSNTQSLSSWHVLDCPLIILLDLSHDF